MSVETERPLTEIVRALHLGEISGESLAEVMIERHERHAAALNAYKTWSAELIRLQAHAADELLRAGCKASPLHAIPISVKDLIAAGGYPTFAGSPRRLPSEWELEGTVIRDIRCQLAVLTGKTHTTEFAFGGLGTNRHWGAPRNPWDARSHRVCGGSSSGAGVSLLEGSALLALGSDSGGSVRIPASATGVVGLKTTIGRWPTDGVVPLAPTLDTLGLLARSVADAAYGFAAIDAAYETPDELFNRTEQLQLSGVRIGICENFMWDNCSPGVAEAVRRALDELAKNGARLIQVQWPEAEEVFAMHAQGGVHSAEFAAFLTDCLPDWAPTLDGIVSRRIQDGAEIPAREYVRRKRRLTLLSRTTRERHRGIHVLAMPTVSITPPTLSEVESIEDNVRLNRMMFRNTCVGNLLSMCGLSIPVGLDAESMPVGLQLLAPANSEEQLLAVGLAAEKVLGAPQDRLGRPPMCRR